MLNIISVLHGGNGGVNKMIVNKMEIYVSSTVKIKAF